MPDSFVRILPVQVVSLFIHSERSSVVIAESPNIAMFLLEQELDQEEWLVLRCLYTYTKRILLLYHILKRHFFFTLHKRISQLHQHNVGIPSVVHI